MHYERLTATDASFLHIETAHEPQHVGSVAIVEGGPLRDDTGRIRIDELRARIGERLHRVPRLRQRVRFVPLSQGRPVWVDDDRFDLDYHVRLTALPRPGDDEQLQQLMGRLQSLPLDRSRPLWEVWFVDGLAEGHVGLITKVHHAMGDGIANVDLALTLTDLEPDPPPAEDIPAWEPRPAPSPERLLADSVLEQVQRPARLTRAMVRAVRDPGPVAAEATNAARTLARFATRPNPAPWNVPVTPHRRWVSAEISMALVKAIRAQRTATLNDVVLEACTGALRTYLLGIDEELADRTLAAMVPVSRRSDDEHGETLGNRVSLIMVDLPVDEPDPVRRLDGIHEQTDELKGSGLADGAETIVGVAGSLPMLAKPMAHLVSRSIPMNLVITNIPGPPVPLYVMGARVLEAYPYVEVIDREGLTIAVVSYEGRLFFGLTADRDVIPDLHVLAEGIEKAAQQLAEQVGATV